MFGKDNSQLSSGFSNKHAGGTNYLRNTVRTSVFSGDPVIEGKLTKAQLYWKYYNNIHWKENNDTLLSFNYCRAIIDKVNNFIIGKEGFENSIVDLYGDEIDEEVEAAFEALLDYNWRKNKKKTILQKILQMGAICGDTYLFLYPNVDAGFVEYIVLDSRTVIPMFKDGNYNIIDGYKVIKLLGKNEQEYIQKVTEYTKNATTTYYIKATGSQQDRFQLTENLHKYGIIPIVHIENIPMSDEYGGKSDLEDIIKLNKVYNEMAEDVKMIIDYYAQPITVITGGTVGQLKRGLNQIWSGLPSDASVFNLSLGEDLGASTEYLKLLKNAMHDLSGVPEEILSKVQHISNTSAAALSMMYQPIIQIADKKSVSYGEGIAELHRLTGIVYARSISDHPLFAKLPSSAKVPDNTNKFFDRIMALPVWKYNLPNDRQAMLMEIDIELRNKIASKREVMERLGKKNIPKILNEIASDTQEKVEELAKIASIEKAQEPNTPPTDA